MKKLSSVFRSQRFAEITMVVACLTLVSLPRCIAAQTTAGSITGALIDPAGAVVANATVILLNQDQHATTEIKTDAAGRFVFPIVLPGRYTITAEAPGFKKLERLNVILSANTALALGNLQFQLGASAETVQIEAQGLEIQTESSQRGGTVVGTQIENIQVNGQSPLLLIRMMPGVVSPTSQAESGQQFGNIYANGTRSGMSHITVNGGTNEDTGANSGWMAPLSLDAVQEVNVLTSNYQA